LSRRGANLPRFLNCRRLPPVASTVVSPTTVLSPVTTTGDPVGGGLGGGLGTSKTAFVTLVTTTSPPRRALAVVGLATFASRAAFVVSGVSVLTTTVIMTEAAVTVTVTSATLTPRLVATFSAIVAFFASV
jgi:hypothetical protein